MNNMSCFADCNSNCLVLRIPYEMAYEIISNYKNTELLEVIKRGARFSNKFTKMLKDGGYYD